MYIELRRYRKKEFCSDKKCMYLNSQNGCTNGSGCCYTAKQFHHWLNENKFYMLKPTGK